MSAGHIPEAVSRLIADRIDSVPELEALLLLQRHKDRIWTATDAAQFLYVSVTVATYVLEILAGRGFFSHVGQGYRYQPATVELETTVEALAMTYARHLIEVTNLIHSKPSVNLRELAEAFRVRKDK